ncbi:hypothetical protein GCT19_38225 [Paraburkholderia sp. CNPSo 3155]|uniref:hypothetical protein n=1 Tax=Paraburkholderia atlantica TaxID=2654982 RepID=UPI00128B7347|nr:hypothetical protein [Paraburkholderia atlantica]MPW11298.1 hypothetical protein [Paraburkholderia atlantica]
MGNLSSMPTAVLQLPETESPSGAGERPQEQLQEPPPLQRRTVDSRLAGLPTASGSGTALDISPARRRSIGDRSSTIPDALAVYRPDGANSTQRHPTQVQHSVRPKLNDYPCSFSNLWSVALNELGNRVQQGIAHEAKIGAALTIYGSKPASYISGGGRWINQCGRIQPSFVRNGLRIIAVHASQDAYVLNIKYCIKKVSEERGFLNEFFDISNAISNHQVLEGHVIPTLRQNTPHTLNNELIAIFLGYGRTNGKFFGEQWLNARERGTQDRMRNAMDRLSSAYPGATHFKVPGFVFEDSAETRSLLANYSREVGEIEVQYEKLLKSHPQLPSNHVIATAFLNSLFETPRPIPLEREAFVMKRRNDAGGDWDDRLNAAVGSGVKRKFERPQECVFLDFATN